MRIRDSILTAAVCARADVYKRQIYGYLWNEARDQWLVDPEAADVVKRIFAMTIDGYGP